MQNKVSQSQWNYSQISFEPVNARVALHGIDKAKRKELVVVIVSVVQGCKQGAKERPAKAGVFQEICYR